MRLCTRLWSARTTTRACPQPWACRRCLFSVRAGTNSGTVPSLRPQASPSRARTNAGYPQARVGSTTTTTFKNEHPWRRKTSEPGQANEPGKVQKPCFRAKRWRSCERLKACPHGFSGGVEPEKVHCWQGFGQAVGWSELVHRDVLRRALSSFSRELSCCFSRQHRDSGYRCNANKNAGKSRRPCEAERKTCARRLSFPAR